MKTFPDLFVQLFMYTGPISSTSVLESIYVDEDTNIDYEDDVQVIMAHLKKFIDDAPEEGVFLISTWATRHYNNIYSLPFNTLCCLNRSCQLDIASQWFLK